MGKRVTVVLDEDVIKKLRNIQAKKINKTTDTVSFSSVINQELRKCVK